jgi:hypothetical protein
MVFVFGLCTISAINFTHGTINSLGYRGGTPYIILELLFFCAYQSTIGPFFWIYIAEVIKIKDLCYPMAVFWGIQLTTSLVFILETGTTVGIFFYFFFASCSLVFALLIHLFAVETKGVNWKVIAERLLGDEASSKAESEDLSAN